MEIHGNLNHIIIQDQADLMKIDRFLYQAISYLMILCEPAASFTT